MRYELIIKPAAERALDRIPRPPRKRLLDAMEKLRDNPRPTGSVKLVGEDNAWRIREGDYRIIFEIHDRRLAVLVVRIGHRKDIYRKGR